MSRLENPPFGRGETFYNGGSIDSNNLGGVNLEGAEWEFEDLDYSAQGAKTVRSNRKVLCRCVRNAAAAALLPKRLVTFQSGYWGARVDGYSDVTGEYPAFPVDEFLPAAGVPVGDLFWVVVKGPAMCKTGLGNAQGNSITAGDLLVALTAVTSGATTAGRVADQFAVTSAPTDAASALAYATLLNGRLGRAITATTTNNTDTNILVDIGQF